MLVGAVAFAYLALFVGVRPVEAACATQVFDHTHQTASGVSGESAAVSCKNGRLYTVAVKDSCTVITVTWQAGLSEKSEQIEIDRFPAKMLVQSPDGSSQSLSKCTPNPDVSQATPVSSDPEARTKELQEKIDELLKSDNPNAADEAYKLLKQSNDEMRALNDAYGPSVESSGQSGDRAEAGVESRSAAFDFDEEMRTFMDSKSGDQNAALPPNVQKNLEQPFLKYDYTSPFETPSEKTQTSDYAPTWNAEDSYAAPEKFVDPRTNGELQGYDPDSRSIVLQKGEEQWQYFDRMWRGYGSPVVGFAQDVWDGFAKMGTADDINPTELGYPEVVQPPVYAPQELPSTSNFSEQRIELTPSVPPQQITTGQNSAEFQLPPSSNETIGVVGEDSDIPLPVQRPNDIPPPQNLSPSALNAKTLADFYDVQGQSLPNLAARKALAAQYGITNYNGSASQNSNLLKRLQGR